MISDDFRLFCGDLGNDVTDEVLTRAFSKYSSFLKAKVVRDKRTNKTKGFGFVSFKDPQDFIRATKEMNGKWHVTVPQSCDSLEMSTGAQQGQSGPVSLTLIISKTSHNRNTFNQNDKIKDSTTYRQTQ